MTKQAQKIVHDALALPPNVRAFVAEKLIESLDQAADHALSPAWQREIEKRCGQIEQGTANLVSAEAVFKNANTALS